MTRMKLISEEAESWNNKGSALGSQGKYDEALQAFDEALHVDPENATAWYNRGFALY
ncbi:tetratricopeptide repeat protein [Candidatus Methanocrinis natronophilus]|uniref:Tetratricopeptide repeat protein n=1 Tax=Candidatus Methanocrinis natronophilus TaxID=3033396 RepID=A0ABT5X8T7_9EURY|nr:tetratricopeptide repeat protein [Candidatus Methanocrinis natronophilus]MDF0591121.1 tetratricopeptide repeat protein [Candidatus Methanocrinis natronophilus]